MGGYLVNFAIYIMAMLGLIFFALLIYQKVSSTGALGSKKSGFLGVEDTMTIGPRKTLYVVRAGSERFLIASDMDKTSLIARLNNNQKMSDIDVNAETEQKQEISRNIDELYGIKQMPKSSSVKKNTNTSVDDIPAIVNFQQKKTYRNKKVIHNMLRKINE